MGLKYGVLMNTILIRKIATNGINHIEKLFITQFLKRLLGVNRSTTNAMTRAENGRYPLIICIKSRILNFTSKLLQATSGGP